MTTDRAGPPLAFAIDEVIALYLGRQYLEPLAGTPFWDASRRAFQKIRATLGDGALQYIERFAEAFHHTAFGTSDYTKKAELVDRLQFAIENRRVAFLTYQSLRATEPVTYDIYPYGLIHHRGSLYLVGWAPEHEELRHWKVDRVFDVHVEELPFERPADFDLRQHLAASFGVMQGDGEVRVVVRFSPTVARYVQESTWHPSQRLREEKDGSLVATFELDGTEEIRRWILSFGQHAEVLKPEELREEIVAELRRLMDTYQALLNEQLPSSLPTRSARAKQGRARQA
jgi:proteasome accessory factor B